MAKINIQLDTETKAITADVDGVNYSNVQEVNMYRDKYDDETHCNFYIYLEPEKNNGVKSRTYLCSAKDKGSFIKQVKAGIYLLKEKAESATKFKKHWLFR